MNRLVVKEVPKEAVPIRPFELKPVVLKQKKIWDKETESYRDVTEYHPWPLDSDVARLIGEAKSLPKGLAIRLEEAIFIFLHPHKVAWYTTNHGVTISYLGPYLYLYKEERNAR